MSEFNKAFEANQERFISEWKEFLRFKSVSTDPAHTEDCRACALWLVAHLKSIGLKAELLETIGKPVVFAEWGGKPGAPTAVFYGHYDVQPVDPLNLWNSPPFEPELRDGRMYARGAEDNKGQLFYFLKAVETLIKANALDCHLKIFLEGEEECGSEGIADALPKWKDKVKGDVLLVCDTGTLHPAKATISMGLRGLIQLTASLTGPKKDLHSGVHGGVVKNPAAELARLVTSLHDASGKIAVEGYYDEVMKPTKEDIELACATPITAEWYQSEVGVPPTGGEQELHFMVRAGFRPTIEVNGIHSGYDGPGAKTIIPSMAFVKITSRIAGGQNPARCLELLKKHFQKHAPKDLTLSFSDDGVGGPAVLLSTSSKWIGKAREVLKKVSGSEPLFHWLGASIPIITQFANVSGAEPLLVGYGMEHDNIHAPNESFGLDQFKNGFIYSCEMLKAI